MRCLYFSAGAVGVLALGFGLWALGFGLLLLVSVIQVVCHLEEHEKRVWSVDFSKCDPTLLASGSDDTKGNSFSSFLLCCAFLSVWSSVDCLTARPSGCGALSFSFF